MERKGKMNEKLGILFDFNGVIIDDYAIQKAAWSQIAIGLGRSAVTDEEMVQKIRGIPTKKTIQMMAESVGKTLSDQEVSELATKKDERVLALFAQSPLVQLAKGLEKFLDELKEHHIPITIASSSTLENLRIIFDRFNLYQWFDLNTIIHKDSSTHGVPIANKPKPDPYLAAAQIIGLPPSHCVVFEDARSGITSALDAGVRVVIAVNTNPEHLTVLATVPGVVKAIHDFSEISADELFQL